MVAIVAIMAIVAMVAMVATVATVAIIVAESEASYWGSAQGLSITSLTTAQWANA
jgi:hypothetical protein